MDPQAHQPSAMYERLYLGMGVGDLVSLKRPCSGSWTETQFARGDLGLILSRTAGCQFIVLFPAGRELVDPHYIEPVGSGK